MNAYSSYHTLVDHGRPIVHGVDTPDSRPALLHLLSYAHERKLLVSEGAWRLHSRECRELEERTGYSPPGGWKGLCGLAAGCRVLRAVADGFVAESGLDEVAAWSSEAARRRLLESYTCYLAPPSSAAGVFILMGLHPVWGLRLAHAVNLASDHIDGSGLNLGFRDDAIFPAHTLSAVQDAVFGATACVVATLRQLTPYKAYPIDALAGVVDASCRLARQHALDTLDVNALDGLPVFLAHDLVDGLDGRSHHRVVDFTTSNLVDTLLVPSGAFRRFDDGSFCTFPNAFDQLTVSGLDRDGQNLWFSRLLNGLKPPFA
ncbi:MAG: hypothetical protein H0U74_10355 [Bradymonadaceae bacterium]|nr:hypothetical protein [Lujinxingiaceae bacterium]